MVEMMVNIDGRTYKPSLIAYGTGCTDCYFKDSECEGKVLGMNCWQGGHPDWVKLLGGEKGVHHVVWEEQ